MFGVMWAIVLVLTWTWRAGGRDSGKQVFFRYVLTVLLLLIVQIGGLTVTFFLALVAPVDRARPAGARNDASKRYYRIRSLKNHMVESFGE